MRTLSFLAALLLAASTAKAQSAHQLVVTVLDPTERSVPGATVSIEQNGTPTQMLVSDGSGEAVTRVLPAGTYVVKVALEGFTDAEPLTVRVAGNHPRA